MMIVKEASRKWFKKRKFREAYDELRPEYELVCALIEARNGANLSQHELAKKMHTTQPMIARMEGGRQPPSVTTMLKVAKATGTRLEIRFVEA